MNEHDMTEQAYKNGYDKGYEDGKRDTVKHGKWERNENGKIVCSVCKNEPLLDDFGHWEMSPYCPHCGARMDGDGNA